MEKIQSLNSAYNPAGYSIGELHNGHVVRRLTGENLTHEQAAGVAIVFEQQGKEVGILAPGFTVK